jgi:drug/metabolite transporter (DMT)-like permease
VAVWSVNVIVVKLALRDCPPLLYTAVRFLVGGLLLLAALRLRGRRPRLPRGAALRDLAVAGMLGIAVNQAAFTLALRNTTAVDVSLIIGSTPLMVAAHRAMRSGERIGPRSWLGLWIGAAGLAMVVIEGGGGHGALGGDLLALAAPAAWTLYVDRLRVLLGSWDPLALSAAVTLLGSLPLIPPAAVEGAAGGLHPSLRLLGCLLFSSVLAVAYCNLAYYHGLETLGPTRAAVYTYMQPFLGAVAAFLMLGETLRPLQLTGGAVVVAGVLLARSRLMPVGLGPGLPAGEIGPELAGGTTRSRPRTGRSTPGSR